MTPINAKQITHINYDEQSEELTVYFHQGYMQAYKDVNEQQIQSILESPNPYDTLVQFTQCAVLHLDTFMQASCHSVADEPSKPRPHE
jgi:hypothetical protein